MVSPANGTPEKLVPWVKNVPELSAPADEVVNTTKSLAQSFAEVPNAYFAGYTQRRADTGGAAHDVAPVAMHLRLRRACRFLAFLGLLRLGGFFRSLGLDGRLFRGRREVGR
jgi:hypothetical protein